MTKKFISLLEGVIFKLSRHIPYTLALRGENHKSHLKLYLYGDSYNLYHLNHMAHWHESQLCTLRTYQSLVADWDVLVVALISLVIALSE